MTKKILLITGGTGYIGAHIVVAFEQVGYQTVIVDKLINSSKDTLIGIEAIIGYIPAFYETDIDDKKKMSEIFEKYSFDGVVHLAGLKSVAESCRKPFLYHENNILGSICLFEVMEKHNVRNIVFSSSATIYGEALNPPFKESDVALSSSPYSTSKIAIESLLRDYGKYAQWKAIALRYFNPIGAHESGFIGEGLQSAPGNLVPAIFSVLKKQQDKVSVFGDKYDTRDGTGVRDYIDIVDLTDAHLLAYERISKAPEPLYEAINICTEKGTTVLEVIKTVEEVTGIKVPYTIEDARHGDVAVLIGDTTLAKKVLGWESKRTLKQSIETAWKFVNKN